MFVTNAERNITKLHIIYHEHTFICLLYPVYYYYLLVISLHQKYLSIIKSINLI